ncbi:MAG: TetR/AcrR family transcriptional regulator [Cytophagia bacterium]|nr:TetR/AcrR family transcriptional regulator [Cytophagia bacterium]
MTTQLVLENGFAGTTIDQILAKTQITKGAFFYHFKSKSDLAYYLMRHFADSDMSVMNRVLADTQGYERNPLERLMAFVDWFVAEFEGLNEPYMCLYASYLYEPEQFSDDTKQIVADSILLWRKELEELLVGAKKEVPNHVEFDLASLADHFTVIMEGAFIVSKALNHPSLTAQHLLHYKQYLELIFRVK